MIENLHLEILPEEQLELFNELSSQSFIQDFYLAGGTSLALQIAHRQSIDFDFFIQKDFSTSGIINTITQIGSYQRTNEEKNTLSWSQKILNLFKDQELTST